MDNTSVGRTTTWRTDAPADAPTYVIPATHSHAGKVAQPANVVVQWVTRDSEPGTLYVRLTSVVLKKDGTPGLNTTDQQWNSYRDRFANAPEWLRALVRDLIANEVHGTLPPDEDAVGGGYIETLTVVPNV